MKVETKDVPFCQRCGLQWFEGATVTERSTHTHYRCRCGAYYTLKGDVLTQPVGDRVSKVTLS